MSAVIPPAGWPANMSADDRKRFMLEQIADWCHSKKVKDALTPEQLGDLPLGSKYHVYKNAILRASIWHCRANPRADARMSLFNIITFLTDNGQGICHLSVAKLCQLLDRHRDTILDNLGALEKDGLVIIYRKAGMMNRYTIAYPRGLAEIGPNAKMVLDAFLESPKPRMWKSVEDAIAHASATNQSGTPDRSGLPYGSDACHPSGLADEPVGSNPHRISSKDSTKETTHSGNAAAAMAAALGGQSAYAAHNLIIADLEKEPLVVDATIPQGDRSSAQYSHPEPQALRPTINGDAGAKSVNGSAAPTDFERFWEAYPPGRKVAKGEVRDLFNQIATGKHKKRRATAVEMIAAAERYAATKPDPQYTPAPTTWLNQGRWEDDVGKPRPNKPLSRY